jgi:Zn2+/Cd2+-exporting ATPase
MTATTSTPPQPTTPSSAALRDLMTRERWIEVARIVITGIIIFLYSRGILPLPVLLLAVAFGLYPLVKTGLLDLIHERKIGTEIFVTIATGIAMLGGEYVAGSVLLVIILIAEFIADLNTDRARASIKALIGSVPQTALVCRDGSERSLPVAELRVGDVVIVRAGEKIPVDGIVRGGDASVNQAPITGESLPVEKTLGSSVFAGTVVELGALDVETQRVGSDTTFSRIIAMVEQAEEQQAPVQKLADRVAGILIPVVFVFLLVVYLVTRDVRLIVTLLIFTSPAELGLATPLVVIAAIARAARSGILVKGGIHLEQLAKVDLIAFDKTGTLTFGRPEVARIERFDQTITEDELLRLAAGVERRSSHPLAKAVVEAAQAQGLALPEPSGFEVIAGRGVRATLEGRTVLAGNAAFLTENGIAVSTSGGADLQTVVRIALDGREIGVLHLADTLRPGAKAALDQLRTSGIKRLVMLTGDNAAIGRRIGDQLGVDEVFADLMPDDKLTIIRKLQAQGFKVAMVGDGINDAPALAVAEVGIAMGAAGTQAALEAADVALMTDDLAKIAEARAIARRAYRTIQENLFVGVGVVHVLGITAALLRLIGPIEAAIIHLGPDILVFLNSIKLLTVRIMPKTTPQA